MNALARLKLFFALSRTPHSLLDMATPGMAVLLYLGGFPSPGIILIGLMTAFAGYTAIYAFNDIVDYRSDRRKFSRAPASEAGYLDAALPRHPMAQGLLQFREGLVWAIGWSIVAVVGAWLLNPVCVLIFLFGAALEAVYCSLWRVSPMRAVVSGVVKNLGAVAAIFAVDPNPSFPFITLLFTCLFFWEIGGQNIPADWTDLEEDRYFGARTIPVVLGERRTATLAGGCILIAIAVSVFLFGGCFPESRWTAAAAVVVTGGGLLLEPVLRLIKTNDRADAMRLFNRASYYPAALLALVLLLM